MPYWISRIRPASTFSRSSARCSAIRMGGRHHRGDGSHQSSGGGVEVGAGAEPRHHRDRAAGDERRGAHVVLRIRVEERAAQVVPVLGQGIRRCARSRSAAMTTLWFVRATSLGAPDVPGRRQQRSRIVPARTTRARVPAGGRPRYRRAPATSSPSATSRRAAESTALIAAAVDRPVDGPGDCQRRRGADEGALERQAPRVRVDEVRDGAVGLQGEPDPDDEWRVRQAHDHPPTVRRTDGGQPATQFVGHLDELLPGELLHAVRRARFRAGHHGGFVAAPIGPVRSPGPQRPPRSGVVRAVHVASDSADRSMVDGTR